MFKNSACDFLGVNFGSGILLGFAGSPRDFFGYWFLPPFTQLRRFKSGEPSWGFNAASVCLLHITVMPKSN